MSAGRHLGVGAALVDGAVVAGDVVVADGRIVAVGASPAGRAGLLAVPGFVDLQVNGFAGVDLSHTDLDGARRVATALAATGVTSFLAALPTLPDERYEPALALVGAAAGRLGGARLLGAHLEGPFLSPRRAGAHQVEWLQPPDEAAVARWSAAGPVRLVTLAPELAGALALVGRLVERGIAVSLGHSDADAATARQAFAAGARAVTHLWNAHRPITARDPGVGGAALADPSVAVCLIADLVHLAPETLRLSLAAAAGRSVLVSDAVAPAGLPDGDHIAIGRPVTKRDGAVRLDDGTLAGSVLRLDQAVRNVVALGVPVVEAVAAASTRPARLVGRPDLGRLAPGAPADVVVLDDGLDVRQVLVDGREPGA